MGANINARLRRTQRGQGEIRDKSHALTQSERLILALVNGVTSTEGLKKKLPGVVERRFRLVVADLIAKGFVEEAIPALNQQPEVLDPSVLERYVHQDPLDPVTITALTLQPQGRIALPKPEVEMANMSMKNPAAELDMNESSGVDFYLPLEAQPIAAPITSSFQLASAPNLITANSSDPKEETSARRMKRARRARSIQIGYWLLFAGSVCATLAVVLWRSL